MIYQKNLSTCKENYKNRPDDAMSVTIRREITIEKGVEKTIFSLVYTLMDGSERAEKKEIKKN